MKKEWLNPEVTSLDVMNTLSGGANADSPDNTWFETHDGKLYKITTFDATHSG